MIRSPLHDLHARLGARFVDFGGWDMPVQYESVLAEHRSVRESAGFFDVSHLGRFELTGPGSRSAIDRLLANDLSKIEPGRTQYTLMLNDRGGVMDDLIVWWWNDSEFWVLPNAANQARVMAAFASEPGCVVEDLQTSTVMIALQGPAAPTVFDEILGEAPNRFRTLVAEYRGGLVHTAGTGYTGERGGEIVADPETASGLVEALVEAGVVPCGLGARDTLRLEAGLPLWGADMDETTTPYEAGLGFAVSPDHDFVGGEALKRAGEPTRGLVGFVLRDRGVPRHGYTVRTQEGGGTVTSGNMSPLLGKGIGLAYVSPKPAVGDEAEVEIRSRWIPAVIAKPPFHKNAG